MKKIILLVLLAAGNYGFTYAQKSAYNVKEYGQEKCLLYDDFTEIPIVLYSNNTYTECGKTTPRLPLPSHAKVRNNKACNCPDGAHNPYIHLAFSNISKNELEYLIRTTDPNQITKLGDTVYLGNGINLKKIGGITTDQYLDAYVTNYTKSYSGFGHYPADTITTGGVAASPAFGNIQFDFDSSALRASSYPLLDATAADLKARLYVVTVAGYASSEGTAAHNMALSRDRANSVKTYLVNSGVSAKQIRIKAFGETHPIADNSTEEGRITNRRVEFQK
jgi:outer membrane protein OmpA-like peptidoglycan-associated protein